MKNDSLSNKPTEAHELSSKVDCHPAYSYKKSQAITGLFILGCFYTLYFAKSIFLPITIAILLNLLLEPIIRIFKKIKIPPRISALLVILILLLIMGYGFYSLSSPANQWLNKAPENFSQVGNKIDSIIKPFQKPIKGFILIKDRLQKSTQVSPNKNKQEIIVKSEKSPYGFLFSATGAFFSQLTFILLLLYFLLASGDFILLKIVEVLPELNQKKEAVLMAKEIRHEINRFLLIKFLTGVGLAIVISIIFFFYHMPDPILWGLLAGVLEFIPYIGVIIGTVFVAITSLLSFTGLVHILLVPITFFTVVSTCGNFIVPLLLSRGLTLHPVIVFVGVVFGGWLWGFAGALIAVPMLSVIKIICNNVKPLFPISKFMED